MCTERRDVSSLIVSLTNPSLRPESNYLYSGPRKQVDLGALTNCGLSEFVGCGKIWTIKKGAASANFSPYDERFIFAGVVKTVSAN